MEKIKCKFDANDSEKIIKEARRNRERTNDMAVTLLLDLQILNRTLRRQFGEAH